MLKNYDTVLEGGLGTTRFELTLVKNERNVKTDDEEDEFELDYYDEYDYDDDSDDEVEESKREIDELVHKGDEMLRAAIKYFTDKCTRYQLAPADLLRLYY